MKLFWAARTRSSRMVWMLEEAGVEYERVVVDLADPVSRQQADFASASPMGKVPALIDGKVAMAESAAMSLYVADRYASGRLAPGIDDDARGEFLYWMFYTPAVIEPAMSEKASGASPNRVSNGWGDFDTMIDVLSARLDEREWLLDSGFCAADVMVGASVVFLRMFGMLPETATSLSAYADRCLARPAYQKAMALESQE